MAGSPFNKGGGVIAAATPPPPAPVSAASVLDQVASVGNDAPVSPGDPFAGVAGPSGMSGYKPLYFLGQLMLFHPTESGTMATTSSTPEKPTSDYVKADFILLTAPETFDNFVNGHGVVEECEPYAPSDRLDDVLVFNAALVNEGQKSLKKGIPWKLVRIVKGDAKKGRNAPLLMVEASDADKAFFEQWKLTPEAKAAITGVGR